MPTEPSWWYRPPGLAALLLTPVAFAYGQIAASRMMRPPRYVSRLPVICVGNFTAGGTGKTPVTAMIARRLDALGRRPAILTRGYGGRVRGPHWVAVARDTAEMVGDEPLLHARIAPTVMARDRVEGAREIERHGLADVILMDDGLQNPGLAKSLSIAVVDGARGLGNGRVIPAGPLRAPLADQLQRVQALLFNGEPSAGALGAIGGHQGLAVLTGHLAPAGDTGWLDGARVVAFAGIGHPERFFATVRGLGALITEAVAFGDHHAFSAGDADRLVALARRDGARLVTTEKDHVRLKGDATLAALARDATPIAVEMRLDPASEAVLDNSLRSVLGPRREDAASAAR